MNAVSVVAQIFLDRYRITKRLVPGLPVGGGLWLPLATAGAGGFQVRRRVTRGEAGELALLTGMRLSADDQLVRSDQSAGRASGATEMTESSSVPTYSKRVIFANSGTT